MRKNPFAIIVLAVVALVAPAAAAAPDRAPSRSRLVSCGELPFKLSALRGPADQPSGDGRLARAMRAYLRDPRPPASMPKRGWRLLRKTAHRALFGLGRPPGMTTVMFRRKRGGWMWMNWADGCRLRAVRNGLQASGWRLDPAYGPPARRAHALHVLVHERSCASGRDARGRIEPPALWVNRRRVAIAMYVTPLDGTQDCQAVPETPATVGLPVALGNRKLFDVGFVPSHRRR
jgi:hypothetical protein